eukprot:1648982-Pyramimonas_sp.AAC.1
MPDDQTRVIQFTSFRCYILKYTPNPNVRARLLFLYGAGEAPDPLSKAWEPNSNPVADPAVRLSIDTCFSIQPGLLNLVIKVNSPKMEPFDGTGLP